MGQESRNICQCNDDRADNIKIENANAETFVVYASSWH